MEIYNGGGRLENDVVMQQWSEELAAHSFGIPKYLLNTRQPVGGPRKDWFPGRHPLVRVVDFSEALVLHYHH